MEALVGKRIRPLTALSPDLAENEQERSLASNDGLHTLKQILDSVRKYRRLVVTMIVVGSLLVAAFNLFMPASYLATAQLAVDVRQSGAADALGTSGAATTPTPGAEESIIDTHVTVLLSDAYLRRLLPALSALEDARNSERTGTWAKGLSTLLGNAWTATKEVILFKKRESSEGAALAALKRNLKAGQERRSRIIGVTSTSSDPQHAAEIANTVAQSYVDEVTRQKQSDVEQALHSLSTQSSKIQHDLAKAEEELKTYRLGAASADRDTLEWRVTTLAQQFETLLRRRQELTAKGLIVQPDVSLLAIASPPEHPNSLHPLLIVPPAAILFALLGCILAVILNRLDRTLQTEADATEALRIPCAGLVPSISPELSRQPQYVLGQPASHYARAIRSILVSILTSGPAAPRSQRIVLVSSSIGGEGKTTLAWSLGLYAARLGLRTLLLDFGQFVHRRGDESASLLSLLTHDCPLADVVEPIQDLGIDYLPAGLSDGNRLQVLANPKISPLLRQLSDTYDLVVIDGPSLLDAPEARLLASWADHVLLAVHCGTTNRETAQTTLHQLARTEHLNAAQTRFSSVLTRADPSQHDKFGRRAEQLLKWIWVALSQRSKAARTAAGTAALRMKRSASPHLKSISKRLRVG
jgi:succinoglycan biosynthesis transport protein ExoP